MVAISIFLVFVLLIPAMFIGILAKWFYMMTVGHYLVRGGILNWLSAGWIDKISLAIFPNLLHGCVSGVLAVLGASLIMKRTRFETASYAVSSIVVVFAFFGGLSGFLRNGFAIQTVELVANTVGIVVGMFFGARQVEDTLRARERHLASTRPNMPD